jgi:hypothetical protein
MEKRREDKRIILTIPRSQWINRKTRLIKERMLTAIQRVKGKNETRHP